MGTQKQRRRTPQTATQASVSARVKRRLSGWFLWWRPFPRRPYWLWLFAAAAVVFHAIFFYWMRPFEVLRVTPKSGVALAVYLDPQSPQSATLAEQSSLLDFEPLFLPTAWNAEPQRVSVFDRNRRTEPFEVYEPEISTAFMSVPMGIAPPLPQTAQEAVELGGYSIFNTFGRSAGEVVTLQRRQGQVQVESLSAVQPPVAIEVPLQTIAGLDDSLLGLGTFLIEVDSTGSVTLPLLRRSTGQEGADRLWADYLYRNAAGWSLAPGTYLLTVGP